MSDIKPTFTGEVMLAARLVELLTYDAATGVFKWRVARGRQAAGSVAGKDHPNGYRQIRIDGRLYLAHRLAWLYVHGAWPSSEIDHRNRIRHDNRIDNLRPATRSLQNVNRQAVTRDLPQGCHTHRSTRKFRARIQKDGKERHLGYFESSEDAANAYWAARSAEYPGEARG